MSNRPLKLTTGRWGQGSHEAFRVARGSLTAYTLN